MGWSPWKFRCMMDNKTAVSWAYLCVNKVGETFQIHLVYVFLLIQSWNVAADRHMDLSHIWKKNNPKLTKVLHNRLPLKAPMASPHFRTEWMSNQWQLVQSRRVLKSTPQGSTENLIKHPIIWLAEQPEGPIILPSVALCWNDSCCLSVMTQKS